MAEKILNYLPGFAYSGGVVIASNSAHLRWWTGFGIWLAGYGLALIIYSAHPPQLSKGQGSEE